MAFTKEQLEALNNSILASGQPITAALHRSFAQKIIDELYSAQSRGDLLAGVQTDGTTVAGDTVLLIRSGQAYLVPVTLFGGAAGTLAGLGDVVITDPDDDDLLTYDTVLGKWKNISLTGLFVTQAQLDAALDALQLPSGARLISAELILTSTTAGTITAQWVDFTEETESVTAEAVTFNGGGLPATGNVRFDIVQGDDAGVVTVKQGSEALPGSAVIPTADASNLALAVVLWTDSGEGEVTQPGGGPAAQNDFSTTRLSTRLAANTTGLFAKVWEGKLSKDGNYSILLGYAEPKNAVNFDGSGLQVLRLSFTCDSSRVIIADTVQVLTQSGSSAGEFVLYQIAGNKAALYHVSSHYWGRIQYRVLFQNNQIRLQDFTSNATYGAAPSAVATYPSTGAGTTAPVEDSYVDEAAMIADQANQLSGYLYFDGLLYYEYLGTTLGTIADYRELGGGGGGGGVASVTGDGVDNTDPLNPVISTQAVLLESNTVPFNEMRLTIIGQTSPRTGNILFDFTDAKDGARALMYHDGAGAFTFPGEAVLNFDVLAVSSTITNVFRFTLTKKGATQKVEVTLENAGGLRLNPYKILQSGATDGQALVWSNANQRYQPGTVSGGGSSPWTAGVGYVYYEDRVAIGTTADQVALLTVKSKSVTNGFKIFQLLKLDGSVIMDVQQGGDIALTGTVNTTQRVISVSSTSGGSGIFDARNAINGSCFIGRNNAGTVTFNVTADGSVVILGGLTSAYRSSIAATGLGGTSWLGATLSLKSSNNQQILTCVNSSDAVIASIRADGFTINTNLIFGAAAGTKIGTATTEKIAFWNKTPIVQPTTGIAGATQSGGGGAAIDTLTTFGGYTVGQLAAILINTGLAA